MTGPTLTGNGVFFDADGKANIGRLVVGTDYTDIANNAVAIVRSTS